MNTPSLRRLAGASIPFALAGCALEDAFRSKPADEVLREARAEIDDLGRLSALHRLRLEGTFTLPSGETFAFVELADPPGVGVSELGLGERVVRVEQRAGSARRTLVSGDGGESFAAGSVPPAFAEALAAYELVRFGWLLPLLGDRELLGAHAVRLGEGRQVAITFAAPRPDAVGTMPLPGVLAGGRVHATLDDRERVRRLRLQARDGAVLALLESERFAVWDGATLPSVWRLAAGGAHVGAMARLEDVALDWEPGAEVVATRASYTWTKADEFPSDRLYEVQESLFGSELATGSTTIDALGRMVLRGAAGGETVQLHVTEAGRFRWQRGEELLLYDTLEDRGVRVSDGRTTQLDEQETVFRSWLYRALLFRPMVLESLNGKFAEDGSIVMATRSMGRGRIALQLRVWVDPAHTRVDRYTLSLQAAEEGEEPSPAVWGAEFEYDAALRVRRITLLEDGVRTTLDGVVIERGIEIEDRAFRDPSWSS